MEGRKEGITMQWQREAWKNSGWIEKNSDRESEDLV
jgi:hypothetical protein